jgi:hypothetical protein
MRGSIEAYWSAGGRHWRRRARRDSCNKVGCGRRRPNIHRGKLRNCWSVEELRIPVVTQTEDTRRENDRMMLNLKGSINESYRKDIGRRVRNKQRLLAGNRRPAGGRAYGYIPASRSGSESLGADELDPLIGVEPTRFAFVARSRIPSGQRDLVLHLGVEPSRFR